MDPEKLETNMQKNEIIFLFIKVNSKLTKDIKLNPEKLEVLSENTSKYRRRQQLSEQDIQSTENSLQDG